MAVNCRNGAKGVDLFGTDNIQIFKFNAGSDDYTVAGAATGNGSIGNSYSNNTLFDLRFEQTSSTGGTWSIARSGE
jgi:hypothetical protein